MGEGIKILLANLDSKTWISFLKTPGFREILLSLLLERDSEKRGATEGGREKKTKKKDEPQKLQAQDEVETKNLSVNKYLSPLLAMTQDTSKLISVRPNQITTRVPPQAEIDRVMTRSFELSGRKSE
ncbi:unnamed protein product [Sphenostylis stenocarpa]|uniref:Uncharacterized protein n=1 Tax=Sphenostylis stenocarpa TaxID=92480 RepID=A0AA86W0K5_9FABA|nr:unnamed protein product [Sphenostylis stenocarpa]